MPARVRVSNVIKRYWRKLYERDGYTFADIAKMSDGLGFHVSHETVRKILTGVGTYFRRPGQRKKHGS